MSEFRNQILDSKNLARTLITAVDENEDLSKLQSNLRDLKNRIAYQSKKNFMLQRDVKYLDGRIGLLIHNRKVLEDPAFGNKAFKEKQINENEDASYEESEGVRTTDLSAVFDENRKELYGNLFFLLQNEPKFISELTRLVTITEIDTLMQTVMFTIYGNQYDSREEYLLLTVFQNVLAYEFESTLEFSSLLRANTPITRMMTTYIRRSPGETYLRHVLTDALGNIVNNEGGVVDDLEIIPIKIYNDLVQDAKDKTPSKLDINGGPMKSVVDPEYAENDKEVIAIIRERSKKIMALTGQILDSIYSSLDVIPYGIRWICKQIRLLTKRKYPEATDLQICSMIGGFFFLRYLNPAIVTPHAHAIVTATPSKQTLRSLTLVAKLIQHMANKPTHAKEQYMFIMNPFVESRRSGLTNFLHTLCEVPDFFESLEMDQYMALTKKDSMELNITTNEIFSMHGVLSKYQANMSDDSGGRLRTILQELGNIPAKVTKEHNKTYVLPLVSRWENKITDAQTNAAASALAEDEVLFLDIKALLIQVIRSNPSVYDAIVESGKNVLTLGRDDKHGKHQSRLTAALSYSSARAMSYGMANKQLELSSSNYVDNHLQNSSFSNKDSFIYGANDGIIPANEVFDLKKVSNDAAISKDPSIKKKGVALLEKFDKFDEAVSAKGGDVENQYKLMAEEVRHELIHIGNFRMKINDELDALQIVYDSITEQNAYLSSRLDTYKTYLNNVREQSSFISNKMKATNEVKLTYQQLEKDCVITESNVPDARRPNIYFLFTSPVSGTFLVSMLYKGRENPILEMDLKLDDILEKQQQGIESLDMEFVHFNIAKLLQLLKKNFM